MGGVYCKCAQNGYRTGTAWVGMFTNAQPHENEKIPCMFCAELTTISRIGMIYCDFFFRRDCNLNLRVLLLIMYQYILLNFTVWDFPEQRKGEQL